MNLRPVAHKLFLITVLLYTIPLSSFSQTYQYLYDIDSSYDWGMNIFNKMDGNYFIIGSSFIPTTRQYILTDLTVNSGGQLINLHKLAIDSTDISPIADGQAKQLRSGGYIVPLEIARWERDGYKHGIAAVAKYSANGDTISIKKYTIDTSDVSDGFTTCTEMPNGDYLFGGVHAKITTSFFPALLVRTDSNGNEIWRHGYQHDAAQAAQIVSLQPLDGGRVLVGAQTMYQVIVSTGNYYEHVTPWFMIIDSAGNIIKDTVYRQYAGGGIIYKDANGGFFHVGCLDSLETSAVADWENFPSYFIHLDSNFRFEYRVLLPYTLHYGHRYITNARQLRDKSYLLNGNTEGLAPWGGPYGWLAKISPTGKLLWNHDYYVDPSENSSEYILDVVERQDGMLMCTGSSGDTLLPYWHTPNDVLIMLVDSNGCLQYGCTPDTAYGLGIASIPNEPEGINLYPNPASDNFNIVLANSEAHTEATIHITDLFGKTLVNKTILLDRGSQTLTISSGNLTPGVYMVVLIRNGLTQTQKLVIIK